jgi:hypothetical protein
MEATLYNRRAGAIKTIICALLATSIFVPRLGAIDFKSLLGNPKAYDGQRVSVIGVVIGDGPEFELFQNVSDALDPKSDSRAFYVIAKGKWARTRPYDLHSVRITGTVNTNRHGIWGYAGQISLETIEVLSAGPLTTQSMPFGVFRNETRKTIAVRLFDSSGPQAGFQLGPGDSVSLPISDGRIEVFDIGGKLLAKDILGARRNSKNYDRKFGAFYYRITTARIEKVLPTSGMYWEWAK